MLRLELVQNGGAWVELTVEGSKAAVMMSHSKQQIVRLERLQDVRLELTLRFGH